MRNRLIQGICLAGILSVCLNCYFLKPAVRDGASGAKPDSSQTLTPGDDVSGIPGRGYQGLSHVLDTSSGRMFADSIQKLIPDSVSSAMDSGSVAIADTTVAAGKKAEKDIPLVCTVNPGSAEGSSETGEYILQGNVICNYGKLEFETTKAVWNRRLNEVTCEGGMKVMIDEMILTAEKGGYNKYNAKVWAQGNVRGSDTSGSYEFTSNYMTYDRNRQIMTLVRNPVLKRFYRNDSITTPAGKISANNQITDTLEIKADTIIYSDSLRIAEAHRRVVITRGQLVVKCSTAVFHEHSQRILLNGKPVAEMKKNRMSGDKMILTMHGEELQNISFSGNAKGDFIGNVRDSLNRESNEKYHVEGDSLFMKFNRETLEVMDIYKNGLATYYKETTPDKVNNMKGEYLRLNFKQEQIDNAVVAGEARSLYYHFDKGKYKGENQAAGDTISLDFTEGKIDKIWILGNGKGTYLSIEEQKKQGKNDKKEERDSLPDDSF